MPWTDPEKRKVYQRRYYKGNKEKILAKNAAWQKANPEKVKLKARAYAAKHKDKTALKARRYYFERGGKEKQFQKLLMDKYGITQVGYDLLLNIQGGVCAICGGEPIKRALDVDHDHESLMVRGLLCNRCNRGLKMFFENPNLFLKAHFYLKDGGKCRSKILRQKKADHIQNIIPKRESYSQESPRF